MKDYRNFECEQFADDQLFMDWVLRPDEEKDKQWTDFLAQNPDKKSDVHLARKIVKGLHLNEEASSVEEHLRIWKAVEARHRAINIRKLSYWAAASIVFVLLVGGSGLLFFNSGSEDIKWNAMNLKNKKSRLIIGNQSVVEFDKQSVTIDYRIANRIKIDQDSSLNVQNDKLSKGMDEIVVPFGKRMQIFLQDGTNLWVNSGSRLVFPRVFNKSKREVYLIGEAFFKIAKDAEHPFLIHTPTQIVKVLGTSFNVKAYGDENSEETVLVEGKVYFSSKTKADSFMTLSPGQKGSINKMSQSVSVAKVDVNNYISWIDGYLIFRNENTAEVIKQVSRYFNVPIAAPKGYDFATFSGKLDMNSGIDEVLTRITKASSSRFFHKDNKIILVQ